MKVPYHFHWKRTPYGNIKVYHDEDLRFVMTTDVFTMAHTYAEVHHWPEKDKKLIGGTFPF